MAIAYRAAGSSASLTAAVTHNINPKTYVPTLESGDLVYVSLMTTGNSSAMATPSGWVKVGSAYSSFGYGVNYFVSDGPWVDQTTAWVLSSSQVLVFSAIGFTGAEHSAADAGGVLFDNSADTVGEWGSVTCPADGAVLALCNASGSSDPSEFCPTGYVDAYSTVPASTRAVGYFYDLTPTGAGGTEDPADKVVSSRVSFQLLVSMAEAVAVGGGGVVGAAVTGGYGGYY